MDRGGGGRIADSVGGRGFIGLETGVNDTGKLYGSTIKRERGGSRVRQSFNKHSLTQLSVRILLYAEVRFL